MNTYKNMDVALPIMAFRVLSDGKEVGSRLGERTMELLHQQIVLEQPWQREVLVPKRGVNIAAQIAETMWVLSGRNDVEFLTPYLPRAKDFSDDGETWRGGYGPRLRKWGEPHHYDAEQRIDQIRHIIDVLTQDRSSRRAVVSIYDPYVDTDPGKDIPCNDFLSFISREGYLHLSVFVRSNDLVWGWSGINAFEWSALQEIVAGLLGLKVGNLVFNTTSLHIYDRHWKKAHDIQDSGALVPLTLKDSPRFSASAVANYGTAQTHPIDSLDRAVEDWFLIEKKIREGHVKTGTDYLVDNFPEPMLQSWLRVLQWYWTGEDKYLKPLDGTRLDAATDEIPASILMQVNARKPNASLVVGRPSGPDGQYQAGDKVDVYPVHATTVPADTTGVIQPLAHKMTFLAFVDNLHREKSAAYGDSWKKRGELFSIIPNIARKIDRIASGKDTADETSADTAIDLLVYLIKYRLWLGQQHPEFKVTWASDHQEEILVRRSLENLHAKCTLDLRVGDAYSRSLVSYFEHLQATVSLDPQRETGVADRVAYVDQMLTWSFILARHLWEQEYRRNLEVIAEREGEATSGYVNQDG